ncbi:VOC family protein [Nocardia salmonicida]|uniref:VOC family protein n=1 Tax=Nocardia salmonicida TaxID=53431 RepID=UPI00371BBB39
MSHRSRLCHIVIDVDDLDHATSFWCAALDATEETISDNSQRIYRRLRLPDTEVRLLLQATTDPKSAKSRMHLDIETDDLDAEVHRLEALGAIRYDHQHERGFEFWVLQDPWHNEFCVLHTEFPTLLSQRPTWT